MKKELAAKVNVYLADIGVLYIKLHNLHWNVVGSQFKAVHEYLESLYDLMADLLDEVAELLKMNGESPLASMKDYLSSATIEEIESKDIDVKSAVETVLSDFETLKSDALEIRKEAEDIDEFAVVNKMEDDIADFTKTIWFVKSMLK